MAAPVAPFPASRVSSPERPNLFGREPYLATNLAGLTGPHRLSSPMLGLDLSAARLADEERPVRRALVVLPPRHMTAALRHRQSRSARLRGQLRPSDDRLVFSDRWARSLSGPSPACRSPVRLAARGPLACSPPPPRFPAPPRFPVHLTALELRTDGALWQTEQRPPRRSLLRPVRILLSARAAAAAAAAPPGCRVS